MGKFNITGQVAGLSQEDAIKAKASNAVTDAGYLGGNSWLKSQIDAQKDDFVNFNDAKEGMTIPDGAFDFFDLTYDLSLKNVSEALVAFVGKDMVGSGVQNQCPQGTFGQSADINILGSNVLIAPFNDQPQGFQQSAPTLSGSVQSSAATFIVTDDYTECGPLGSLSVGNSVTGTTNIGYKISGQNPPTDDAGGGIYRGTTENYSYNFWQYKDATAAQTGFRYMVGVYATDRSALSSDSDDKYVVKSMSLKTTKAGVSQLVLHCRKAAPTTGVTINASGYCKGIKLLKLNY
jgi:hypothetical protein